MDTEILSRRQWLERVRCTDSRDMCVKNWLILWLMKIKVQIVSTGFNRWNNKIGFLPLCTWMPITYAHQTVLRLSTKQLFVSLYTCKFDNWSVVFFCLWLFFSNRPVDLTYQYMGLFIITYFKAPLMCYCNSFFSRGSWTRTHVGIRHTIHNIKFNQHPTAAHNITFTPTTWERITLIAAAHSLLLRYNVTH